MSRKLLYAAFAFLLVIALTSTACCGLTDIIDKAVGSLGGEEEELLPPGSPTPKPPVTQSEDQPAEQPVAPEPPEPPDEPSADSPPAPAGVPGRTMYVNGNQIEDLAVDGDTLWVATLGGVVAWDLNTGESVHYTTFDGLSSNGVFDIEICPGVIAGTDEGLDIFDPDTGRWSHRPELLEDDPPSPGDPVDYFRTVDEVMALQCDMENNRLFIDYWSIRILDLNTGEVTELTEDDGLPHNGFSEIAISGEDVWIATGWGGIARITNGTDITVFDEESGDLTSDYVDHIVVDQDGGVWGASSDDLHHYSNGTWENISTDDIEGFGFFVYDMAVAPDGSIWIGFSDEVCRFDPATVACTEVIELGDEPGQAAGWLDTVMLDENGRFFYGTDKTGVSMFDDNGWTLFALEDQPLADNVITAALEDSQGNIWIGTSNGGASRFTLDGVSQETFTYENSDMNSNYIADIAEGPDGSIWFLHSYSLSSYADGTWTVYEEEDGVREEGGDAIAFDDAGQLWLGGDEGYSIFDGSSFTNVGLNEGWPEGADIYALLPDGDAMWAGTNKGLFSLSGTDFTHVLTEDTDGLRDEYFQSIARMPDGNLLLAHSFGLTIYEPGSGDLTDLDDGPSWVNGMLVLPDGSMWVASSGLHHFDGSTWEVLTPFDGMPHYDMRAVLVDSTGALWAGGGSSGQGGGLVRIADVAQGGGPPPQTAADAPAAPRPAGDVMRQWASGAEASTQYGTIDWAAIQAAGAPNTPKCGDYGTAWASSSSSGVDWLELSYDTAVTPTEVNIIQTYSPNQVVEVKLIDTNGTPHVIYNKGAVGVDCPFTLTIPVNDANYKTDTVRLSVDQTSQGSWNEIDAVELVGY